MGADSFIAFYGLRFEVPADDDSIEHIEQSTDPRLIAARGAGLQSYFGRLTDGEPYFLMIGAQLGRFGIEGDHQWSFSNAEITELFDKTRRKLSEADFDGEAKLWMQFEGQY